jgi:hypothetical protein
VIAAVKVINLRIEGYECRSRVSENGDTGASRTLQPMKIEATDHALEFIAEHGGKLYIWVDDSEFGHASPKPPDHAIEWVEYADDGITLFQDSSIGAPDWWRLEFHHLPRPHVTALWDGGKLGDLSLGRDADPDDLV